MATRSSALSSRRGLPGILSPPDAVVLTWTRNDALLTVGAAVEDQHPDPCPPPVAAALTLAREIKAHAPHCRVLFTVYEMKRLDRDAAELTAPADHLTAHGLLLEMPGGPLPRICDPGGPGRMLVGFFAAMAETERESIREAALEGLDAAARKGNHGGRPPVITDDTLHTVLRRRAAGESAEKIQSDLIIPTGKRKGQNPGLAGNYPALAEHEKRQAYPEAVQQAHADFAALRAEGT
ncbi:recombinase family protein [Streptomyces sp. NPDC001389]|uniref:recombinase family protein n=1 Tax=unclassified Streptomyces TaxID=2593676 RepID=UPI0036838794